MKMQRPTCFGCRAPTVPDRVALDRRRCAGLASSLGYLETLSVPQLSLHSPVGDITVFEEDGAIISLDWGWAEQQIHSPILDRARAQIDAYFDGELTSFDLPLAPAGTTYRRSVWQALCEIPYGETRSYLDVARRAGGSARSVGQANGCNPIPLIIPCHRVVATTHIGGYSGGDGLPTKRWLLALENPNRILL
jgi:methylated-DNA-[protein]-cysteine S-methyltransferase